ncbi:MAG: radical SAM protein [Thermodesulfovibrionales bacterium]|nr:radical SAM protein [Thermodesulfovibrionales bacterium]
MNKKIIQRIDKRLNLEKGTIYKSHGGRLRIALVYPNVYKIGMSNLGFQGIYGLLNSLNHVVCERAFLPDDEDINEHQRTGTPIYTYESKTPLNQFDIIAFSISYELDYINIARILLLSKIPFFSKDREKNHPIIIAGGVCCSSNPEPFAQFFDAVFVGESEELLPRFIRLLLTNTDLDKRQFLSKCNDLEGLYIPEDYTIRYSGFELTDIKRLCGKEIFIKKATYPSFNKTTLATIITTPESQFSNMHLVEVMRGCHWRCRFCLVGSLYNPVRIKDPQVLKDKIVEFQGQDTKVGLIAPSITDYKPLIDILAIHNVCLSITSIRANTKAFEVIDALKNIKSISIAPETGNERLRKVINKRIKDDDILTVSEYIIKKGIDNLRLYFMIGLPTETQKDIEDITSLIKRIRGISNKTKLSITVSAFVPKPFTPFQWHGFSAIDVLKAKISYIHNEIKSLPKTAFHKDSLRDALMQAILARGGRYLSNSIINIAQDNNTKYILSDKALQRYFCTNWQYDAVLPWDFIQHPQIDKEILWQEYQQALSDT